MIATLTINDTEVRLNGDADDIAEILDRLIDADGDPFDD